MEKTYFVKFLPVPGEIKRDSDVGSHVFYKGEVYRNMSILNNKHPDTHTFIMKDGDSRGYHEKLTDITRARLFLCSNDIKVGDRFKSAMYPDKEFECLEKPDPIPEGVYPEKCYYTKREAWIQWIPYSEAYKIVGPASGDAVWVTEGMIFPEDQVGYMYNILGEDSDDEYFTIEDWPAAVARWYSGDAGSVMKKWLLADMPVSFKCPTCKTFH